MNKAIIAILVLAVFMTACSGDCNTGMYKSDGRCCTSVCKMLCKNGYKAGSCGCECNPDTVTANQGSGVDQVFDPNTNVNPPSLPS